jgi:hypothetical protein
MNSKSTPKHLSQSQIINYLADTLHGEERDRVQDHLGDCSICSRRCERSVLPGFHSPVIVGRFAKLAVPHPRHIIDWILTKNEVRLHDRYPRWREATLSFLCTDQPHLILQIAKVLVEHEVNIQSIDYHRNAEDARYAHLELELCDVTDHVESAVQHFVQRPMAYSSRQYPPGVDPLVSVASPIGINLEMMCEDEVGVVANIANLISTDCTLSGSLTPFIQTGSFVRFNGRVETEGGFSEGGTPGFHIKAIVAAPRTEIAESILGRVDAFGKDHLVSGLRAAAMGILPEPTRFRSCHDQAAN